MQKLDRPPTVVKDALLVAGRASLLTQLFHGLAGTWKLERHLSSSDVTEPSGECHGISTFAPRPLSKIPDTVADNHNGADEMLYHEEGKFYMRNHPSGGTAAPYMTFSRRYVWRMSFDHRDNSTTSARCVDRESWSDVLDEMSSVATVPGRSDNMKLYSRPVISLWFTKPGTTELDYLFHHLDIQLQTTERQDSNPRRGKVMVHARGSHLCVQDQYETEYAFIMEEDEDYEVETSSQFQLVEWKTVHTVKGPKKDQRIETKFLRYGG